MKKTLGLSPNQENIMSILEYKRLELIKRNELINMIKKYKISKNPEFLIKSLLKKNNLIICGALGYEPKMTSDGTAANIAREIKADYFINITNVSGLYDKDPRKNKNAKFISRINFNDFLKIVMKIKYKPGQHFVLDQTAAEIITKYKIKTVILKGVNNLEGFLREKKFIGTVID